MIHADFSNIADIINDLIDKQKKIRLSKCCYTCDNVNHTDDGRCYCKLDNTHYGFYCVCGRYKLTTTMNTEMELDK
jgi:hypothetical protein